MVVSEFVSVLPYARTQRPTRPVLSCAPQVSWRRKVQDSPSPGRLYVFSTHTDKGHLPDWESPPRRRNRLRGAQCDRRLDQSADVASVRSAVQPSDGGAGREQARHRRVVLVEDGAVAVDHDAAHGGGNGRADRHGIIRRGPDWPGSVSVAATRR